jgi:hypothetical protein
MGATGRRRNLLFPVGNWEIIRGIYTVTVESRRNGLTQKKKKSAGWMHGSFVSTTHEATQKKPSPP